MREKNKIKEASQATWRVELSDNKEIELDIYGVWRKILAYESAFHVDNKREEHLEARNSKKTRFVS